MTTAEAVLLGPERALVGVYEAAADGRTDTAVLLLNAGLIHHAGPARLYVLLARALSASGIASVRFDLSGIGDSPPRLDNLPIFETAVIEPVEVMDDLARRGFRHFFLVGICAGAYCAYQVARRDTRVVAAVLVNPQDVAGDTGWETRAWARRYWANSIFRPGAWLNLLTGRVNYRRLARTLAGQLRGGVKSEPEAQSADAGIRGEIARMTATGQKFLFALSGKDVSREYLQVVLGDDLQALLEAGGVEVMTLEDADHLFTRCADQQALVQGIRDWVARVRP